MTLRIEQGKGAKDRYAMLSPVLLQRLRTWWRVARAQGKMLEGGWLFPGLNPVEPLSARQLNRAVLGTPATHIDHPVPTIFASLASSMRKSDIAVVSATHWIIRVASTAFLGAAASGCAMTYDVVKMGDDTYQTSAVASPARGGISGAQQMAVANANKKGDSLGKKINVTNVETGHEFPAAGRAIVTFTCT